MDLTLKNVGLFSDMTPRPQPGETIRHVRLDLLDPFPCHPYAVDDDEDMQRLIESIRDTGVQIPVLARPALSGRYQLVSGHRRVHAARLAGMTDIPAIIRELDDDQAVIAMVDSNLARTRIPVSQQARALRMRQQALNHQGRHDPGGSTRELLAAQTGVSPSSIARLTRLGRLDDRLLDLIDQHRLPMRAGLALADTTPDQQQTIGEWITGHDERTMSIEHARRIAELARQHEPIDAGVITILTPAKPKPKTSDEIRIPISWLPDGIDPAQALAWIQNAIRLAADRGGENI